jgi:hypothetical protein
MSKIEELDHKIGRHEGTVIKTCALCRPETAAANIAQRWWDHEGAPPRMPRFGDLWRESALAPVMVFVSTDHIRRRDGGTGGIWVSLADGFNASGTHPLFLTPPSGAQIELTEGGVNLRAERIAVSNYIPAESGRSGPLGVDMVQWAQDQNYAKLVAMMQKEHLFPIGEIAHDVEGSLSDLRTTVRSICSVIRLTNVKPTSEQITVYESSTMISETTMSAEIAAGGGSAST